MNWLYLKKSRCFLNVDHVKEVRVLSTDAIDVYSRENPLERLRFTGEDAAKVIEYLERVAYA